MTVEAAQAPRAWGDRALAWIRTEAAERRILIMPAVVIILLFSIFPLIYSLALTFTDYRLLGGSVHISVGNWTRLFHDGDFRISIRNTFIFTTIGVTIQYTLGFALALLLNTRVRFRRFLRVSFLLPMMMSPVAVSYVIGKMLFDESFGPLNDILTRLHLPALLWSTNPNKAMAILIAIDTWQWTPFFVLILLAGLQTVPPELYEAARMDGATSFRTLRHVVFPLLLPLSATAILIRALEAFKTIDIVRVVTGGGPGNGTETATLYAYDMGVKGGDIAYASTTAYAFLVMVIAVSLLFLMLTRRVTPSVGD